MHGASEIALARFTVVAPVARRILHILGQQPVGHQQAAEGGFEFDDEIAEDARIQLQVLFGLEARQNLQRERGAGAMHERRQKSAFHMLAPFPGNLLRPQSGQPCLLPQLFGLRPMAGGDENFAAQHHRHGDVAHLGDAEPGHRLLQRNDRGARPQRRRIRHPHDLPGKRRVGLDQARELGCVGHLLRGEFGQLRAHSRQRRDALRTARGVAQVGARRLGVQGGQDNCGLETHCTPLARTGLSIALRIDL
jgi:hypothetical protein